MKPRLRWSWRLRGWLDPAGLIRWIELEKYTYAARMRDLPCDQVLGYLRLHGSVR